MVSKKKVKKAVEIILVGRIKMSKKISVEEAVAAINVGNYIIDQVEKGAAEQAKKELKEKRKMWKYTGKYNGARR